MSLELALGRLRAALPDGFDAELSVVARGPAQDGHQPNLRISHQTATEPVPLEVLAREYQKKLEGGFASVELLRTVPRRIAGGDALEQRYRIKLDNGMPVIHEVLIVIADRSAMTVAANRREDAPASVAQSLTAVLAGVRLGS